MARMTEPIPGHDPGISVIIPVRNGEGTIVQCLSSVLDQSISDYEVVVIDNGSTDSTKHMISGFSRRDPRVKYHFESRKGRGHARVSGIESSRGRVLAWTDADCVVPKDWLERLTRPILEGKESVVQGNEDLISTGFWSYQTQLAGQRHMDDQMKDPPYIDHLDTKNLAIAKEVLVRCGGFNRKLRALEDFELKVRLKRSGERIFYMRDLKVKHHHRESFRDLFRSRFEQGYWAAVIYFFHKDFFDTEKGQDNTIKSMYMLDVLMFPAHLVRFLFRNGPREFLFEAATGYIWRLGNLKGRLDRKNVLEDSGDV